MSDYKYRAVGVLSSARIAVNTDCERFPLSWRGRLVAALGRLTDANLPAWTARVGQLNAALRGGVRPDASDADVCQSANVTAADFARRLRHVEGAYRHADRLAAVRERYGVRGLSFFLADYARALLARRGIADLWPEGPGMTRAGAIARMGCEKWWRRTLRTLQARTVEACSISLGLVSRTAGLYASDDAVRRRRGQNARNAAALESVTAVNDMLQVHTLADLAATGTANKRIRRIELLTRIAGFELLAKRAGHEGVMVTMTCPSRFHKMTTRHDGRTVPNRRYDGSTPRDAQAYLMRAWARCRAAAQRAELTWYGFRIAEPQHDATPHWHCLLFVPAGGVEQVMKLVRKYFLDADSPNEPGAQQHRVDFERIDWSKGSAVGYVIKYVSKNIDGHGVGLDLEGGDAVESSARVEAWAATWRIRQFQQIGGAPVGVWRELRRIDPDNMPDGAAVTPWESDTAREAFAAALSAVNFAKTEPGVAAVAWSRYTTVQGGIGARRRCMPLALMRQPRGAAGRYGERLADRVIGVDAAGVQRFRNHVHAMRPDAPAFERPSFLHVESERCRWVIVRGGAADAQRAARAVFERSGEAASTRIHVNNCTGRDLSQVSEFAPVYEYRPKLGRFTVRGGAEGPKKEEKNGTNRTKSSEFERNANR